MTECRCKVYANSGLLFDIRRYIQRKIFENCSSGFGNVEMKREEAMEILSENGRNPVEAPNIVVCFQTPGCKNKVLAGDTLEELKDDIENTVNIIQGKNTLFVTSMCKKSKTAKDILEVNGVKFTTANISSDLVARKHMEEKIGDVVVPSFFNKRGKPIVGLDGIRKYISSI